MEPTNTFFVAHALLDEAWANALGDALEPESCTFDTPGESLVQVLLLSRQVPGSFYVQPVIARAVAALRKGSRHAVPVWIDGLPKQPDEAPYGLSTLHALDGDALGPNGVASRLREHVTILRQEGQGHRPSAIDLSVVDGPWSARLGLARGLTFETLEATARSLQAPVSHFRSERGAFALDLVLWAMHDGAVPADDLEAALRDALESELRDSRVALSVGFAVALDKLDAHAREQVLHALPSIVRRFPSLREQNLGDPQGFLCLEVNHGAHGVVAIRHEQQLHLAHVEEYTAALAWARTHRVAAGAVLAIDEDAPVPVGGPDAADLEEIEPPGPLAHFSRSKFVRLGLPDPWAREMGALDEDQIHALSSVLRPHVHDALYGLATGEPYETVIQRFDEASSEHSPAQAWPGTPASEIRRAMQRGDWSVYLHPSQVRLIRRDARGAMKITGGPGTGKTVVAVHRARFLAEGPFAATRAPILLTTPVSHLAGPLQQMVDRACADRPEVASRIVVRSVQGLAQAIVAKHPQPRRLADAATLGELWAQAMGPSDLPWSKDELAQERIDVLDRNDAWTWEAYRDARREGRRRRLGARQREAVWRVLEAFEGAMAERGVADPVTMARLALGHLRTDPSVVRFAAIVCDEVQDASSAELRLLAALASDPAHPTIRANGLTLCGDGFQRLFASPVVLSRCGIEVRGRSHRLQVSYRTTEGIRRAAVAQVAQIPPDPFDRVSDDDDTPLEGFRSLLAGRPPQRRWFRTDAEELGFIRDRWLDGEGGLLVLTRTEADRDRLVEGLRGLEDGTEPVMLDARTAKEPDPRGLTVCTIARAKGLEAPRVVIAAAQHLAAFTDGPDYASAYECRLAYTAMTRGRDWLAVTGVRTESNR
ncbi:MAG: UvrD-helicase domain-containing protein [Myxococcota bacterium]